jgi:hypothetical protein
MKQLSSCKLEEDTAQHPLLPHRIGAEATKPTLHTHAQCNERQACIRLQALRREKSTIPAGSLIVGKQHAQKSITEPSRQVCHQP